MPKKRFSADQIVTLLRQIEVSIGTGRSAQIACREAVLGAREKYQLSERHACRLVGQPRGTQRYTTIVRVDEDALTQAIYGLHPNMAATAIAGSRRCSTLLDGALVRIVCNASGVARG